MLFPTASHSKKRKPLIPAEWSAADGARLQQLEVTCGSLVEFEFGFIPE
jgi:hypothetical protein